MLQALNRIFTFCLLMSSVWAAVDISPITAIRQAELHTLTGVHSVQLPHALTAEEFAPTGSLVRFRLDWPLAVVPDRPQAAYVSKLSLSGQMYVNGQLLAACGNGPLPELRCLHQPQLFTIPASLLQVGSNVLEFEIYATSRQMNGLSAVQVGDADALYDSVFSNRHFWTVDVQVGLTWLSTLLGLLSLTVGLVLRRESVFIWFGLTSIMNAFASLNSVVTHPIVPIDIYNWMIFSSRLVSVPLAFLTLLAVFKRDGRRIKLLLISYVLIAPIAIWISDNSRVVAFALYMPLVFACPWMLYLSVRWSWASRDLMQSISTLMMFLMFMGGVVDWLRLGGQTQFDGIYLSSYTYSGMLVTIGLLLVSRLASALVQSQKMGELLERQVAERIAYEVTEHIPVGTFTIVNGPGKTTRPRFSFMSRRFLQITGLDPQKVSCSVRHAWSILYPEDRAMLLGLYTQAIRHKLPFSGHLRILVHGQLHWIHLESAPRELSDGSTVWEGVLIDETPQVLAREASERDRAALQEHLVMKSRLKEREDLLRDVHDGFGSQLASVRMMVEKGSIKPDQLPGYLSEVSDDLRLVMDTLSPGTVTLADALYDMRYRIERRMGSSGIQFKWQIELTDLPALSSRTILQILRITQEAMHNAIRHAEPRHLSLTARYHMSKDQLFISVQDDGIGMPEQPRHGRGLSNMRHRSREIGAHWAVIAGSPGTTIELRMDHPGSSSESR